ncbi:MAG: DUF2889 domain-containing protein [Betaproteobacteria bacterium]|nr:DUF2889 domain-containing protein [Betaproteobacteria bacterium]
MPSDAAAPLPARTLKHTRTVRIDVYARADGLWDAEAHITDVKTRDATLAGEVRKAGDPVHDMTLTVTVDTQFNVVAAQARTDAMPYPGLCTDYGNAYDALVGLNLLQGFHKNVRDRLGGVRGCTHITELAQVLPTAVVQAFAGEVLNTREQPAGAPAAQRPFQIDRCHALRSDGEAVARFYPQWSTRAQVAGVGDGRATPPQPSLASGEGVQRGDSTAGSSAKLTPGATAGTAGDLTPGFAARPTADFTPALTADPTGNTRRSHSV